MSEDEHQRVLAVKTVAAVFLPIACITVMLRCYVRGWVVKGFGWDDGSMVLAMVCDELPWHSRVEGRGFIDGVGLIDIGILYHVLRVHDWRYPSRHWTVV